MKTKLIAIPSILAVFSLLTAFSSCAAKGQAAAPAFKDLDASMTLDEAPAKAYFGAGFTPEGPGAPVLTGTGGPALVQARQLVKTGNVSLEVRDLQKLESAAKALAESLGGYVADSSRSASSLNMTLRIPQASFPKAMEGASGLGRVVGKGERVEDVTLQYADMESRIASKKILRDRYTAYLKVAKDVEDLLAVERSLNEVLAELDSYETQFRVLANQVDYSTVSLYAELPPEARPAAERSFLGGLIRLWDGFKAFLFILGYVIVGAVLFGVPVVLVFGALYFLLFGKIGLLRKFFALLSPKRTPKA